MANNGILAEFSSSDIAHFRKDFVHLVEVGGKIDRHYGKAHHDLDMIIPKYDGVVSSFNKKYKGIRIKTKKTIDSFKLRVFVDEKSVQDFFGNSASKIAGLKSAGKSGFDQADVGNAEKFASLLDSLQDKLYLSYSDAENGTSSVAAVFDRKEKMTELIFDPADITNESSACFRICAYYALRGGFDRKIEIYGESSMGFSNKLSETEKREFYDRFNPRFLE